MRIPWFGRKTTVEEVAEEIDEQRDEIQRCNRMIEHFSSALSVCNFENERKMVFLTSHGSENIFRRSLDDLKREAMIFRDHSHHLLKLARKVEKELRRSGKLKGDAEDVYRDCRFIHSKISGIISSCDNLRKLQSADLVRGRHFNADTSKSAFSKIRDLKLSVQPLKDDLLKLFREERELQNDLSTSLK